MITDKNIIDHLRSTIIALNTSDSPNSDLLLILEKGLNMQVTINPESKIF